MPIFKYQDGTECECDELVKNYYASGALFVERPMVNGKVHGTMKTYDEVGPLKSEFLFINGKIA
jgi:antitoxin component YwqK of YwqJK toxin-antitoxin module